MIYNHSSVLLLCIVFLLRWYFSTTNNLKFLFIPSSLVIRCTTYEYLIVSDWLKLLTSKISCPNQAELFPHHLPDVYDWDYFSVDCDDVEKKFNAHCHVTDLKATDHVKNKKSIKDRYKLMHGTITVDNHTYPFQATTGKHSSAIQINYGSLNWSPTGVYIFQMTFTEQPIMCYIKTNLSEKINNGKCTNKSGSRAILCYIEPLSKSDSKLKPPITTVNWTQLFLFFNNPAYPPNNWENKGGYYLDVRLLNKSTTLTSTVTTSTTSTSEKSISTFDSTWMMNTTMLTTMMEIATTRLSVKDTTVITAIDTTVATAAVLTTVPTTEVTTVTITTVITVATVADTAVTTVVNTSTTTAVSTIVTTVAVTTANAVTNTAMITTLDTAVITATAAVTAETTDAETPTTTAATTTVTIATVTAVAIVVNTTVTMAVAATVATAANTTAITVANRTVTLEKIRNPSSTTSTALKPSRNKSTNLKKPSNKTRLPTLPLNGNLSSKKRSSTHLKPLTVFFIVFIIFCIIGLVALAIFRFRKTHQRDNESLLDQNDDGESHDFAMEDSETDLTDGHDTSTDVQPEIFETKKSRKGSRLAGHFDPDEL